MARRLSRPAAPATLQTLHVPAPIGGINTIDVGSAMPPGDCVDLWNLLPAEYGLRSRLGFKEWCTGLTGGADNTVRAVLPFSGSKKSGTTDKLFAATAAGIWDATTSSATPAQLVTFGTQTGDAGFGVSRTFSTPGGRFLVHCDEENGLYIWSESSSTWSKAAAGVTQVWQAQTTYLAGNQVVNGGNVYTCATGGVSAVSGGPTGTGAGIADGTATWNYVGASSATVIGPSLGDQQAGFTLDPANFAFVCVWKERLWFIEKDSTRAWYLPTKQLYGTATSFDFGAKMRAGGILVGLYNWSYDAGSGMDSLLVGISSGGDVVIYQGTDPSSANTFMSNGCWFLGGVPYGRHIATEHGGDLLVVSLLGVIPLSKLVVGQPIEEQSQYATAKVQNLFNVLASTYKTLQGWALHIHPEDNALLVLVPSANGQATGQLAMSFATKGWSRYRGLPLLSAGVWNGQLYFGTPDGRVCINAGYLDGLTLADPNAYTPIQFYGLSAFSNLGNARQKQIQMIRPSVLSQSPSPLIQCTAKYGYDMIEPAPPTGAASGQNGTWDNATWDSDVWGGDYSASQPLRGATGMGREAAIAFQGEAISRTTLVGFDVYFTQGGLL